jgi:hypothetical protein
VYYKIFGRGNDSEEWTLYYVHGSDLNECENDAVLKTSGKYLEFPEGVKHIQVQFDTQLYGYSFYLPLNLRIKPTAHILSVLDRDFPEEQMLCVEPLDNSAMFTAYEIGSSDNPDDETLTEIDTKSATETAYLHGHHYKLAAKLEKLVTIENQEQQKQFVLKSTGTLTQWSSIPYDASGKSEFARLVADDELPVAKSGYWYDLLPIGTIPDMTSISITNGTITGAYKIENYAEGRTLLIVHCELDENCFNYIIKKNNYDQLQYCASRFMIQFTSYMSYDNLAMYGLELQHSVRNLLAFETDGNMIGTWASYEGEPDDPTYGNNQYSSALLPDEAILMTGLDNGRTDPSFVYAVDSCETDDILYAGITSSDKFVSTDGSHWGKGREADDKVTVYEGTTYSYRITVTSGVGTTGEILVVDQLEANAPLDETDRGTPSWRGTLESVDVSPLVSLGIAPVVYYAVGAVDVTEKPNVTQSPWTTTAPADLSTVTAIAVDASKKSNGEPYIMQEYEMIGFLVHMRAPIDETLFNNEDPYDADRNAHAFNTIYLNSARDNTASTYVPMGEYTKVGIVPYEMKVRKVWDDVLDNDRVRPQSITLHLYANGEDTGRTVTLGAADETSTGVWEKNVGVSIFDEIGDR